MSGRPSKRLADDCKPVPVGETLPTLEDVVNDYISEHRPRVTREMNFYARQPSLEAAIEVAGLAHLYGKRHAHQRRIPATVLQHARDRLLEAADDLQDCKSFDELFHLVEAIIRPIEGIGELAVYDAALRLGAYMKLAPELVYIHMGARTGFKNLGLHHGQTVISPADLPEAFRWLEPREIEDCLCIYKDHLRPQSPFRPRPETVTPPAPAPASEITDFTPADGPRSQRMKHIMDLGRLRTSTTIHSLAATLGDKDANVRWLAGSHLVRFGGRETVDTLAAYLASDPPAVGRVEALRVLGLIADADEDEVVRKQAGCVIQEREQE